MSFTYPTDLIPRLRKVWLERRARRQQTPLLPRGNRLSQFLEVAYHASLLSEERRKIRFRLAAITRKAAYVEAGAAGVHRKFELVEFARPREFSVSEILRLAPATDVTRTLICVQPASPRTRGRKDAPDSSSESGNSVTPFEIWGLLHTGSSWWEFTHGECLIGIPPPNCFTVSSTEPGNLAVSHEGDVLLSLRQGEIVAPSGEVLDQGPISDFLRASQNGIYGSACREIGADRYDCTGQDDRYPTHVFNNFIERILFQIREKRHGGTLLIVPNDLNVESPELMIRLLVKYPSTYDNAWPLLVSSLVLHRKYFDLYLPLWNQKSDIPVERYQQLSLIEAEREEIQHRISDSVTLLASTSGVDGAVVITDRLRLLGFGAEVIASFPELKNIRVARDPFAKTTHSLSIDSFGTRHRSAFRFCSSFENSVAFVVSQDGGVKAVKRVDDRLILWPDINFGPMGI